MRDLLDRAVVAGVPTRDQAAAVTALAAVAALFLGAELWDELGPWPRTLLLAAVTAVVLTRRAAR